MGSMLWGERMQLELAPFCTRDLEPSGWAVLMASLTLNRTASVSSACPMRRTCGEGGGGGGEGG